MVLDESWTRPSGIFRPRASGCPPYRLLHTLGDDVLSDSLVHHGERPNTHCYVRTKDSLDVPHPHSRSQATAARLPHRLLDGHHYGGVYEDHHSAVPAMPTLLGSSPQPLSAHAGR